MNDNAAMKAVVDLLSRLVACPSVNPGAAPVPDWRLCGEVRLAEELESLLRSWGARTTRDEWAPNRCSLVATWAGKNPRRSLLLDAHMDTVGVEGMAISPFQPSIREERLYGRGACDTKGPMAAMLLAIRTILDEEGELPVTLHFAATGDEEAGARGVARLVDSGLRPDAAIIAEPTGMKVVYAHKGACRFRVTLRGRAAHSSIPERGINAVEGAAAAIVAIRRDFIGGLRVPRHSELGSATVASTMITGGQLVNIIPDQCCFEVDCRCLPGERRKHMESLMGRLVERVMQDWPGMGIVNEVFQWYPALAGAVDHPFVARMSQAVAGVSGSVTTGTEPYGTDGGFYGEQGVPCVVFGPGSISHAHTADESIELAQVCQAIKTYASMIRAFGTL